MSNLSKLDALLDNKLNVGEEIVAFSSGVENIVGKGKNSGFYR